MTVREERETAEPESLGDPRRSLELGAESLGQLPVAGHTREYGGRPPRGHASSRSARVSTRRVSAGSMTSSISKADAMLTALPRS